MVEKYDNINYFIYNKIDKYNKQFEDFKKQLNSQDEIIKKKCAKNIKQNIKQNPKKHIKNIVNLTKENNNLTETTEEDINETKKMLGGNVKLDENDYDYDTQNLDIQEIIIEEENIEKNNISTLIISIFIFLLFYIFAFIGIYYFGDDSTYKMIIFKPLIFIIGIFIKLK